MNRDSEVPYKIYCKTEEGLEILVASKPSIIEAERLVANLNDGWPGEYSVRVPSDELPTDHLPIVPCQLNRSTQHPSNLLNRKSFLDGPDSLGCAQ
jgi:hypothetical protein